MDPKWNEDLPIYRQLRDRVVEMILEGVLADERVKTPDLGGRATTADMTRAVTAAMSNMRSSTL